MKEINIIDAINEIYNTGHHSGTIVTDFNPRMLNFIGDSYEYYCNKYEYEGNILLQERDCDSFERYSVIDPKTNNEIGIIGYRKLTFSEIDDKICNLLVK